MKFQQIQNLLIWAGLPYKHVLKFQQADPDCPSFKVALEVAEGFDLKAAIKGKAKAKAYLLELDDPPTPGEYVLELLWGDDVHPLTITVEPGDNAPEVIEKIEKAIEALLIEYLKVCPKKCGAAALYVLGLWPGLIFSLRIVSQPGDDLELELLQDDAALEVFTVSSAVVGDYLEVTLKLSAKATAVLPPTDGPYDWSLIALHEDDPADVLLLARGTAIVTPSPTT